MIGRPTCMGRRFLPAVVAALAAGALASAAQAAPDEVLVSFAPGADRTAAHAAAGGRVVDTIPAIGVEVVQVPAGRSVSNAVRTYRGMKGVRGVGPNADLQASLTPNDPLFAQQWNFGAIGMPVAWDRTAGQRTDGTPMKIAVLDTGVAYENYTTKFAIAPDLVGTNFDTARAYDYINNDTHANDDNSHGTHVAGTLVGATNNGLGVAGIAHKAQLLPIKVLGATGSGSYSAVAKGILRAAGYNVAGSAVEAGSADVISMSLGGGADTSGTVSAAMKIAYDRGATIVAAAGNANASGAEFPANADASGTTGFSVIGVGATGYFDASTAPSRAPYSNYGAGVDIYAPGGDMSVKSSNGILQQTFASRQPKRFGYYWYQGTSMATPHVAAVAALVEAVNPGFTPAQVEAKLKATGTPWTVSGVPVLNADKATAPPATP